MGCLYPLQSYRAKKPNDSGKYPMVFTMREAAQTDEPIDLPCGKCHGCRADKTRDWGIRCYHESLQNRYNSFITLTYDDDHLPPGGKLAPDHLRSYIKALRKLLGDEPLRYFACGEYGSNTLRPHYHMITFGQDWRSHKDKQLTEAGAFSSGIIGDLWEHGSNMVAQLDPGGCFYVAGYETKKLNDPDTFTTMSRNIGKSWAIQNQEELRRLKAAYVNGNRYPIPKKYLDWLPEHVSQEIKDTRKSEAQRSYLDKLQSNYAKEKEYKSPWRQKTETV